MTYCCVNIEQLSILNHRKKFMQLYINSLLSKPTGKVHIDIHYLNWCNLVHFHLDRHYSPR